MGQGGTVWRSLAPTLWVHHHGLVSLLVPEPSSRFAAQGDGGEAAGGGGFVLDICSSSFLGSGLGRGSALEGLLR